MLPRPFVRIDIEMKWESIGGEHGRGNVQELNSNFFMFGILKRGANASIVWNPDTKLPLTGVWHWSRPLRVFSRVEIDGNFLEFVTYFSRYWPISLKLHTMKYVNTWKYFMIIAGYVLLYKKCRMWCDWLLKFSPKFRLEIDKMFWYFVGYIIEYYIDQAQTSYNKRWEYLWWIYNIHRV